MATTPLTEQQKTQVTDLKTVLELIERAYQNPDISGKFIHALVRYSDDLVKKIDLPKEKHHPDQVEAAYKNLDSAIRRFAVEASKLNQPQVFEYRENPVGAQAVLPLNVAIKELISSTQITLAQQTQLGAENNYPPPRQGR